MICNQGVGGSNPSAGTRFLARVHRLRSPRIRIPAQSDQPGASRRFIVDDEKIHGAIGREVEVTGYTTYNTSFVASDN